MEVTLPDGSKVALEGQAGSPEFRAVKYTVEAPEPATIEADTDIVLQKMLGIHEAWLRDVLPGMLMGQPAGTKFMVDMGLYTQLPEGVQTRAPESTEAPAEGSGPES